MFNLVVTSVQFHRSAVEMIEWKMHEPVVERDARLPERGTVVKLQVQRLSSYYIHAVILPLLMLCVLAFGTFALPIGELGNRLGTVTTLLLTAVAFKFVIGESVPKLPYSTLLDSFVAMTMFLMFLIAAMCIGITLSGNFLPTTAMNVVWTEGELSPEGGNNNLACLFASVGVWGVGVGIWLWRVFVAPGANGRPITVREGQTWYHLQFAPHPCLQPVGRGAV